MGGQQGTVFTSGRNVRTIYLVGDTSSSGSLTYGTGDVTWVRNGTGDMTFTFVTPFAVLIGVSCLVGTSSSSAELEVNFVTTTTITSTVQIIINDDAGTAADAAFYLQVSGIDDPY